MGKKGKKSKENRKSKKKREIKCKNSTIQHAKENVDIDKEEEVQVSSLNFSQRKDRFLIVTTVIGVLVFVLKNIMQMSVEFFDRLYLNNVNVWGINNVFISGNQVISAIYISSCICIIGGFLIYCVCELCNFQSSENNFKMEEVADKWYASVFKIALALLGGDAIGVTLIMPWFSDRKIEFYIMLFLWLLLGFIILGVGIKSGWKKKENIKNIIGLVLKATLVNIGLSFVVLVVFFSSLHKGSGTLDVCFVNEKIILEFEGNSYPTEVECVIECEEGIRDKKYDFEEYGEQAGIQKMYATERGKDDNTKMKENYYYRKYTIDITNMYTEGKNKIDLIFYINNIKYHIRNSLYYDGQYDYVKSQMQTEL